MIQPSAFETRHTYTIHGKIASGGMGTIRLGLQRVAGGFSRVVAVKQIHAMYANNQEFAAMFRDELRVASRVVHPNVVPILDVISADDKLSLIMEYVHGLSLARLLRSAEHAPSPEIATTIMIGMLHGLHAAHEALSERGDCLNIVHRDVTPHNVMVGVDGTPRVLDFGIAHALGHSPTTTAGPLRGKAKYLAPEQLEGESVDRRADIYSASVVFWEMLTGRRLFPSNKDGSIDLTLRHLVEGPHLIQPGISPHVSQIVLRGLQPEPQARYATALEMAVALEESAGTVSATKVGQWVKQVWGKAGLARLQEIRAIEGSARGASNPDDDDHDRHDGRGRDHQRMIREGEIAGPSELSDTKMIAPGQLGGRVARESRVEPTISWGPEDSLFGPRRELPPLIGRQGRKPDKQREETVSAESPWPVKGQVSAVRMKGQVATLAAVLVALGSTLALFVVRGAILPATRAPVAANRDRAADLQATPPAPIRSVPVIEMTTPQLASPLPPDGGPTSDDPVLRTTPGPVQPEPATAAAGLPAFNRGLQGPQGLQRAAQSPRRWSAHAGRAEPPSGSRMPRSRKVSRKSPRTASVNTIGESVEEAGAAEPPVLAPPSCDPPYVIDAEGIKRFKPSCL